VTGEHADDETIENIIETGNSETFLQKAIQEQGRGQVLDTIKEIQERHDAVKEIERNLIELNQIFMDMATLVEAQGEQLNDIEQHVNKASSFVERGTHQLKIAKDHQRNTRKCVCIGIALMIILILIVLLPILHIVGVVWWFSFLGAGARLDGLVKNP
jgi:syntaxin 1B/2/3